MTSLRNRILFFFTLFALVSLAAVFMSSRSTQIVGEAADSVANHHLPLVHSLGNMKEALLKQDVAVTRYIATGDKKYMDIFEKERLKFTRAFVEAEAGSAVQSEQDKFNLINELYAQYEHEVRQILHSENPRLQSTRKMLAKGDEFLAQIQPLISQIDGMREGMTVVRQEQIQDILGRHKKFAWYFLISIAILFTLLALYLWYYLVRPLSMLLDGIRNFTRGRLDVQIPAVGKDELGELQEAFNEMSREIAVERKRLKSESQSDALTGLFNMRYFRLQLAEEFSRSQRYAHPLTLLMLDVDHFKSYNDRNGHPAGDIVLKEISRILIRNVRGTDIVARYGGEEFVILLPETGMEASVTVAEKIRRAVELHHFPFQDEQELGRLSLSVGVASYPDVHVTSDRDLVEASDKALYNAKKNGRNRVCLYTDIDGHQPKHKQQRRGKDMPLKK